MRKTTETTYQYTLFCWAEFSFALERLLLLPLLWTRLKPAAGEFIGVEAVGETGFAALADGKVEDDEEEKVEEAEAPSASGRVREQFLIESEQQHFVEQQGSYRPLLFLGRTMPTTSRWNLAMIHGVRAFKSTLELCLFKGMRIFFYGLLAYRLYLLAAEGNTDFSEITGIFTSIEGNGITNLVHVLSNVARIYLELMLYSPLIIGGLVGIYAAVKALWLGEPKLQRTMGALERIHPGCCTSFVKEYQPFCNHSSNIQRLEYVLRWDGRLAVITRQRLLKSLQNALLFSRKKVREQALLSLAKLAHFSPSVLFKMKAMGYDDVYIADVTRTAAEAYECLYHYAQFNKPGLKQNILQSWHIIKAKYYIWWLGQMRNPLWSIFFLSFTLLFHTFHAGLYFSFLNTIVESINCPTKPGFTLGKGYADWSSEYTPECFQAVLNGFRSYDLSEPVESLLAQFDRFHLAGARVSLIWDERRLYGGEVAVVVNALKQQHAIIQEINLDGNPITLSGFIEFCRSLYDGLVTLRLRTYYQDTLRPSRLSAIQGEVLGVYLPRAVQNLHLQFIFEAGAIAGLVKRWRYIQLKALTIEAVMHKSNITNADILGFAENLPSSVEYLFSDLLDNTYDAHVYGALAANIPRRIKYLSLQRLKEGDAFVGFLMPRLPAFSNLITLDLEGSFLGQESILRLLNQSYVANIGLGGVQLTDKTLSLVTTSMSSSIKGLGMDWSGISSGVYMNFTVQRLGQLNNYISLQSFSLLDGDRSDFFNSFNESLKELSLEYVEDCFSLKDLEPVVLPGALRSLHLLGINLRGKVDNLESVFSKHLQRLVLVDDGLLDDDILNLVKFLPSKIVPSKEVYDFESIFTLFNGNLQGYSFFGNSLTSSSMSVFSRKIPKGISMISLANNKIDEKGLYALLRHMPKSISWLALYDNVIRGNLSSSVEEIACRPELNQLDIYANPINYTQISPLFKQLYNSKIQHYCQDLRCHAGFAANQQCGIHMSDQYSFQLPAWLTWPNLVATAVIVILLYAVYTFYQSVRGRRRKQQDVSSPSRCCGLFQRKQSATPAARPSIGSLHIGLTAGTQARS